MSKSVAQRELNALRDPIALLPVEISSKIFLQCLPPLPYPTRHEAPMLLMNVCHLWSNIALSTPMLWASLHLKRRRSSDEVLQSWLPRARDCSLSLSVHGMSALFQRYAPQLKHLTLYRAVPHFHPSTSFSSLETLVLGTLSPKICAKLQLTELLGLFRLTPNLVQCTLPNSTILSRSKLPLDFTILPNSTIYSSDSDDSDSALPIVTLPHLRCLEFGEKPVYGGWASGDEILRHLSLPALETLAIPFLEISFARFSLFLRRSVPPLCRLVLSSELLTIEFSHLEESFRLLPLLTHFELYARLAVLDADLFTALAHSESLLPNLRNMKITSRSLNHSGVLYGAALRMLSARQTRLLCFHLCTEHAPPDAEVLDGLRQLVAGGMEIFVGKKITKS
ncbi:F-box domain-containing protein [Mycena sanguinolenta]|uniref:F-box domain-containing protein n=1 Tax=Mycena sanguinolenta TaxID=230812 RepID=A0A8H6YXS7_9AGAR|nr:F-box domain-containing protein [Mycena sanguinolenta]